MPDVVPDQRLAEMVKALVVISTRPVIDLRDVSNIFTWPQSDRDRSRTVRFTSFPYLCGGTHV